MLDHHGVAHKARTRGFLCGAIGTTAGRGVASPHEHIGMSYNFYIILHVTGIAFTFTALGGAAMANAARIAKGDNPARAMIAAGHGVGLLLIFVSGFGLMAKIGMMHGGAWPAWIIVKLLIWLLAGALIVPLLRKPGVGKIALVILPLVVTVAAWFAKEKPGGIPSTDTAAAEAMLEGSGSAE